MFETLWNKSMSAEKLCNLMHLTAYLTVSAQTSGARNVLKKPLSIDDLVEAVERFRQSGDN